jgi:pilus assembly protein TadC
MKNAWHYSANPDNIYHDLYQQVLNTWALFTVYQLVVLVLITMQVIHSPLAFVLSLLVFHILGGFVVFMIYLSITAKFYTPKSWN